MILTDIFSETPDVSWDYAVQMGISHAVMRLPEHKDFNLTHRGHWRELYDRFVSRGLKPIVIEPLPNRIHEHIKRGDAERDAAIRQMTDFLPIMQELGIHTICVNFMAYTGWFRYAVGYLKGLMDATEYRYI
jgi:mannonate dehydratase